MKTDNNHKTTIKLRNGSIISTGQSTVIQKLDKKCIHYPIQTKLKIEEGTLISKMAHISFVV